MISKSKFLHLHLELRHRNALTVFRKVIAKLLYGHAIHTCRTMAFFSISVIVYQSPFPIGPFQRHFFEENLLNDTERFSSEEEHQRAIELRLMSYEPKSILPRLWRWGRKSSLFHSKMQFTAWKCRILFPV